MDSWILRVAITVSLFVIAWLVGRYFGGRAGSIALMVFGLALLLDGAFALVIGGMSDGGAVMIGMGLASLLDPRWGKSLGGGWAPGP